MSDDERWEAALARAAAAMTPRGPCLDEERALAFHAGGLSELEAEAVREHLATCSACVGLAREALRFTEAMRFDTSAPAPVARMRRRVAWAAAAMLAAAALVGLFAVRQQATPPALVAASAAARWRDLPIAPAPYVPRTTPATGDIVWRDAGRADPLDAAMERYLAGEYGAAEEALESYVVAHPADTRARLYLAVTRLYAGRNDDARRELERIAESQDETVRREAPWYLALALLRVGREDEARRVLVALAAGDGPHRADAAALVGRMGEAGES